MNIVIRCDVGKKIGLGHYYRCIVLKKAFEQEGIQVCLALKCLDNEIYKLPCDLIIKTDYLEELEKYNFKNTNLILDIYHRENYKSKSLQKYLAYLKKYANKVAFIEGLENDACPPSYYSYVDILIAPYMICNPTKKHPVHFLGKNFLILDESRILKNKDISNIAKQVLITFGGSDPYGQSVNVLNAISQDKRSKDLEVTVIIGPLMPKEQIVIIEKSIYSFRKLNLTYCPDNLKNSFYVADVAITNTGQTRYELAASGVPFIICPFDDVGYRKSIVFAKSNSAQLEPYNQGLIENTFQDKFFELINNYAKRLAMSMNGKKHFYYPQGVSNLAKSVLEVWA